MPQVPRIGVAIVRQQRPCRQPHGTVARYAAGCSCFECCEAHRKYMAFHKLEGPFTTDGDEARAIIRRLRAAGHSRRAIAEGAGLGYRTLRLIESGESSNVRVDTLEALKAYRTAPHRSTAQIPARSTLRLIERMARSGMSRSEVAHRLGLSYGSSLPRKGQRTVRATTAARVEELALSCGVLKRPVDMERVMALHAQGMSAEEIAGVVGCTSRTIFRALPTT